MKYVFTVALSALIFISQFAHAVPMTGIMQKDNHRDSVTFDLQIGYKNNHYSIEGSPNTDKGIYESDLDFSTVQVTHQAVSDDGKYLMDTIENSGTVVFFPRVREIRGNVKLAGIPIQGSFLQGWVDDGIWFDGLVVNGTLSAGALDYNTLNGYYNSRSSLKFGKNSVTGTTTDVPPMNYNSFVYGEHAFDVSMLFGELKVTGRIMYTDISNTYAYDCSYYYTDPRTKERVKVERVCNGSKVVSTNGKYALEIRHTDGTDLQFSTHGEPLTKDDELIREFIAFIQVTGYDVSAE